MSVSHMFLNPKAALNWLGGVAIASALVGCGGGGSSDSAVVDAPVSETEEETQLLISLTDAEGDFLSYAVEVNSISFTRANGAVVTALSEATTVDFAQYVDISELLAVRSVPVGRYESVVLNMDFSDAQIIVQSESGEAIEAEVLDEAGETLESVSVEVSFGSDEGVLLSPRVISHITLDFDLDASNEIQIDGSEASVTVNPVWVADSVQGDPKPLRLRGVMAEVDETNASFDLDLRPFRKNESRFGEATIFVDELTEFEIDGLVVENADGLAALDDLSGAIPVVTLGNWDKETETYTATEVLAGSSVPWAENDILRGTVISRTDLEDGVSEIGVRGAVIELSDGRFAFNDDLKLIVGSATTVHKYGEDVSDTDDISIGSSVRVTGTLLDDRSLDASAGVVRVRASTVSGSVVSSEPLVLDLSLINGRRASIFDFAGTGVSEEQDADPDNYELDVGEFDTSSMFEGSPVRALGFVSEFGTAPEDFDVRTLVDASNVKGVLTVHYGSEGSASALSIIDSGLLIDLAESRARLVRAGIPTDLSSQDSVAIIVEEDETGIYSLIENRSVMVYTAYSDFADALEPLLESGASTLRFTAQGEYDSVLNSLASKRLQVHIKTDDSE